MFRNTLPIISSRLKYKLALLFIVISLAPLLLFGITSYSISKKAIDQNVDDSSEQLIRQTAENIDLKLSVYKDMMMQILSSPDILDILKELNKTSSKDIQLESTPLSTKLAYYMSVSDEFKSISFITRHHYIHGFYVWANPSSAINSSFFLNTIAIKNQFEWFPTRAGQYYENVRESQENVFTLAKQVFDFNAGTYLDMVAVLDIREAVLKEISNKYAEGSLYSETFIVDSEGTILSHSDDKKIMHNISQFVGQKTADRILHADESPKSIDATYQGDKVLIKPYKLKTNNWRVVTIIDKATLYKESKQVFGIMSTTAIFCIVLSILSAIFMAQTIADPLKRMVIAMRRVNVGDFSVRLKTRNIKKRSDEIDILQDNFDYMVSQMEELLKRVIEEQNNKRAAEIKALEAQINPHFLYNTLDAIKWTALFQKANNAAEMASMLSRLLHISLGKGREIIRIEEEIEHVQCYLAIQKFRFDFNIETRFEVEDNVRELYVPKLILQPLVENAIMHGFVDREEGGIIIIRCYQEGNELRIDVIDNGVGMTQLEAHNLINSKERTIESFSGIGIPNVEERIKLICGDKYGLTIKSEYDKGTAVLITLPARIEGG